MSLDDTLATRFVCSKCRSQGGHAERLATTGTGLSKLFDIQHRHYIAVSCTRCGYTELFNPKILGQQRKLGTILDILFGG
ncbi:MAG: hypothetical protein GF330_00015 [Candidatus Eisenbacteria bacterium]|nr:hypothetical protein [Candidatus Eisenbacteria bacterium]